MSANENEARSEDAGAAAGASGQSEIKGENLGSCDQEAISKKCSSSKPRKAIRKQVKLVIGSLECILDELKSVVGDLRHVVGQIDDVTSQIEDTTAINEDSLKVTKSSGSKKLGRKDRVRHSMDSGLPESSSTILSEDSIGTKCRSQQGLNHGPGRVKNYREYRENRPGIPVCSPTESSRWSDNELLASFCCRDGACCRRSIAASGGCCAHERRQKQRRHSHNNTDDTSLIIPSTALFRDISAERDLLKRPNNDSGKLDFTHSRIGKKHSRNRPVINGGLQNLARQSCDKSLNGRLPGKKKSSATEKAGKSSLSGAPSMVRSEHSDYYELQLEQQLENMGRTDGIDNGNQSDNFSTFSLFSLRGGRKSYSDTLYSVSGLHASEDTAYESDSSREGGGKEETQSVIKPSDTFRYKVKQIGMRKMTMVGSCRVVIEP